jgi:predicted CXXCH cytochrome family protein
MKDIGRYYKPVLLMLLIGFMVNVGLVLAAWNQNPEPRIDLTIEGYFNANDTGKGDYLRTLSGQNVHNNFFTNTNSCASCHMTHMAPGQTLLFQRSVYNTCTTCHFNETMGTFNVLNGLQPGGAPTAGGRFFDGDFLAEAERPGASYHLATGLLQHWQAPGSGITDAGTLPADSPWLKPFACGSCHAPHGSYSGRHIQYNPNGTALRYTNRPLDYSVTEAVYTLQTQDSHLVPWLYYDREDNPEVAVYIYKGSVDITNQFEINYATGKIKRKSGSDIPDSVTFSHAFVFGMNADGTHKRDVVAFCVSCHTEFTDGTGFVRHQGWTNSARSAGSEIVPFNHKIGINVPQGTMSDTLFSALALERDGTENRLTCLTCHYAHGTDLGRMQRRSLDGNLEPLQVDDTATLPAYTATLRYLNPENGDTYGGRFEACYVCHNGKFLYKPQVTATRPVAGSTVAASSITTIEIDFDIPLAVDRVSNVVYSVKDNLDTTVSGTLALSGDRTLVFTPSASVDAGMQYTVMLGNVMSEAGGTLTEYTFSFHTYLEVAEDAQGNLLVSPTGTGVAPDSTVEAVMTAGVNAGSVDAATFVVSYMLDSVKTQLSGSYSVVNGNTVRFTPDQPLPAGQTITVELYKPDGVAPGIEAVSGAPLGENVQWTFTVQN